LGELLPGTRLRLRRLVQGAGREALPGRAPVVPTVRRMGLRRDVRRGLRRARRQA